MFLLIDCNSFYASCERVFNPKLARKLQFLKERTAFLNNLEVRDLGGGYKCDSQDAVKVANLKNV
jgi:nucleotidyltransferase/DNA polymerase involved in DNA repair